MLKDGALKNYQNLLILEGEAPKENIPSHIKIFYNMKDIKDKIDEEYDGVYATLFSDKILYYNSTKSKKRKKVVLKGSMPKFFEIEADSLTSIDI